MNALSFASQKTSSYNKLYFSDQYKQKIIIRCRKFGLNFLCLLPCIVLKKYKKNRNSRLDKL